MRAMELLLAQVARLLGLERAGLTAEGARAAIAAEPGGLGRALVAEAADSDDVTGAASARARRGSSRAVARRASSPPARCSGSSISISCRSESALSSSARSS